MTKTHIRGTAALICLVLLFLAFSAELTHRHNYAPISTELRAAPGESQASDSGQTLVALCAACLHALTAKATAATNSIYAMVLDDCSFFTQEQARRIPPSHSFFSKRAPPQAQA